MIELIPIEEEKNRHKYDRKKCIEAIQTFVRKNGRTPVAEDFRNNPKYPSVNSIKREFGTWNKALEAAGLKINLRQDYNRQELIVIMQQFQTKNGRSPRQEDFTNNNGYPSIKPYIKEFGSFVNGLIEAGFKPNDNCTKGRIGEIQVISEFKTDGAIDLSGQNRNSACDGQCPKGELFDTKSATLISHKHKNRNDRLGWAYSISEEQLMEADYIYLRAYEDEDFSKPPKYKWRIPIEIIDGKSIFIYNDNYKGRYNIRNMKQYEI